jgi:hypothetical protein
MSIGLCRQYKVACAAMRGLYGESCVSHFHQAIKLVLYNQDVYDVGSMIFM